MTARGIVFLLLFGTTNLLVRRELVERYPAMLVRVQGVETRAGEQRTVVAGHVEAFVPRDVLVVPGGNRCG